jgi:hypothetical protein
LTNRNFEKKFGNLNLNFKKMMDFDKDLDKIVNIPIEKISGQISLQRKNKTDTSQFFLKLQQNHVKNHLRTKGNHSNEN